MPEATSAAGFSWPTTRRVAVGVGVVALASVVSLGLFFAVGGAFGTINDLGNALIGILSALLAWVLRRRVASVAMGTAVAGGVMTVLGSALVISDATGYFLAGLVSNVGFALIGLWLITLNWFMRRDRAAPGRLAIWGIVAGVAMSLGLVAAPGVALGLDNQDTAPAWIWIGVPPAWLGTYVLYPIWSIRFGRASHRISRDLGTLGSTGVAAGGAPSRK